jgi:deazaflavin-dependent oxidoreductase (nitroreductase family)
MPAPREYRPPSTAEKTFNRIFGFVAGLGLGPSFIYLLQVRGRKSGKLYSTAVNILELNGKQFLVAPRGRTQWVKNAEASGEITLKRRTRKAFRLRSLADEEKPEVLQHYLGSYKGAVQRFFPVPQDASLQAFAEIASGYPVFELIPA